MTLPKSKALGPVGPGAYSYWVDKSLPDLSAELKGLTFDQAAFVEWLSERVGNYRASVQALAERPQVSALVAWLKDIEKRLPERRAWEALEKSMPPLAEAAVWHAAFKSQLDWHTLLRDRDCHEIRRCVQLGRESLESQRSRRGRPSQKSRDVLLAAIVAYLRDQHIKVGEAERLAEAILIKCRIPVPEESVPRAARRGR